jgi:hypothetical protein
MLSAIAASFVFHVLTGTLVGINWLVLGMIVGVLDPQMDPVLDLVYYPLIYIYIVNKFKCFRLTMEALHDLLGIGALGVSGELLFRP